MASISRKALSSGRLWKPIMTFRRIFREICVFYRTLCLRRSSVLRSVVRFTLLLIYPHRKKSRAVKSGKRGWDLGMLPFREIITQFGNKSFRIFILTLAVHTRSTVLLKKIQSLHIVRFGWNKTCLDKTFLQQTHVVARINDSR